MEARPPLTPELRRRLGLPLTVAAAYPWGFAVLIVAVSVGPLWLAGYRWLAVSAVVLGLGLLPLMRWLERRESVAQEQLYLHGREGHAVVIEVEPAGERRVDHRVRLEVFAQGRRVLTTVVGSPLARKGLGPGDEVRVLYDEREPRRCLILERARREIVDAIF